MRGFGSFPLNDVGQGMHMGFGGNPYGPAGTGKTESVKALGQAFGRQVSLQKLSEAIAAAHRALFRPDASEPRSGFQNIWHKNDFDIYIVQENIYPGDGILHPVY